jgi:hypothetical protein
MTSSVHCKSHTSTYTLIIDDREGKVSVYIKELASSYGIKYKIQRIQIGDYAISDSEGNLVVCIERKTYEDFAASFKDGRYNNREKLRKLSCRIAFCIEGKLCFDSNKKYGHIPYRCIESAIDHMMIRDNFSFFFTLDQLGTAKRLMSMTQSLNNMKEKPYSVETADCLDKPVDIKKDDPVKLEYDQLANNIEPDTCQVDNRDTCLNYDTDNVDEVPDNIIPQPLINDISDADLSLLLDNDQPTVTGGVLISDIAKSLADMKDDVDLPDKKSDLDLLTTRQKVPDIDIVRTMWACFRGISVNNADIFMQRYTISQILRDKPKDLSTLTYSNGRRMSSAVLTSLSKPTKKIEIRLLAAVPSVSKASATTLLEKTPLATLLSYSVETLSMYSISEKSRLGQLKAANILKYFNWKMGADNKATKDNIDKTVHH